MKQDKPVFTGSAAVKVSYVLLRLSTPSRHNRANWVEFLRSTFPEERDSLWLVQLINQLQNDIYSDEYIVAVQPVSVGHWQEACV